MFEARVGSLQDRIEAVLDRALTLPDAATARLRDFPPCSRSRIICRSASLMVPLSPSTKRSLKSLGS